MSWKGFQKGIARTPQNLLHKMHHVPKDPMFVDVQDRFDNIEKQVQRLREESKRYWDAIGRWLHHQVEFANIIQNLYGPVTGRYLLAEGEEQQDPSSSPDGALAAEQYKLKIIEMQELVQPELEMIETKILKPADDLLVIINSTKKMLTKREHKRLDLDRQEQALKKIQDKDERTAKQEEKMYKVENNYEIALEEYKYYNELLLDELPKLFGLGGSFIRPLFQSFYFMQLNIYYTMHIHMSEMKIPHFDLSGDIISAFVAKHEEASQRLESIDITHFRTAHPQQKLEALRKRNGRSTSGSASVASSSPSSSSLTSNRGLPPKYEAVVDEEPQPPRPPRPSRNRPAPPPPETCTALYDFEAQGEGDLSFHEGDVIEVVKRTEQAEGWWTGFFAGKEGTFPGNYVKLN